MMVMMIEFLWAIIRGLNLASTPFHSGSIRKRMMRALPECLEGAEEIMRFGLVIRTMQLAHLSITDLGKQRIRTKV